MLVRRKAAFGILDRRAVRMAAWLMALVFAIVVLSLPPGGAQDTAQGNGNAVVLHIDGAIGPATSDYFSRELDKARQRGAAVVILRMDTPGGLDTSMRDIIRTILGSPVPIITYVSPSGARAASAGTYILYASHVAAMTPGTNLGAATPVQIGGGGLPFGRDQDEDKKDDDDQQQRQPRSATEAKIIEDAVAYIRSLAELRDRNADWAEKAVREAASLSASAALEENVIDIVADTIEDVLAQADGRRVTASGTEIVLETRGIAIEHVEPDWRTRLLSAITNPNVALILMMIGIYGLIFEFMNPGAMYPGTIGAISLLVALYALAAMPVNVAGIGLIILGLALMVAEAFAPSFGILGIGGAVAFILGATILIEPGVPGFEIAWPVIAVVALTSLGFTALIAHLAVKSHRRRVATGDHWMVGAPAEVQDWRGNQGHVFVHGERWRARSEVPLKKGQQVRITGVDGLVVTVEPDVTKSS
jgi:membrane-bound serine protease (ClpP class)